MGLMDKAKKFAEQAQKEAKDGTLKDRAKALAEQAQTKLDEVQTQFNDGQKQPTAPVVPATPPADVPPPDAAATAQAAETVAETVAEASGVDRSHEAAPKLSSGDPLAG